MIVEDHRQDRGIEATWGELHELTCALDVAVQSVHDALGRARRGGVIDPSSLRGAASRAARLTDRIGTLTHDLCQDARPTEPVGFTASDRPPQLH